MLGFFPVKKEKLKHTEFEFYENLLGNNQFRQSVLKCFSMVVQNVFLHLPMMGGEIHEVVQVIYNGL